MIVTAALRPSASCDAAVDPMASDTPEPEAEVPLRLTVPFRVRAALELPSTRPVPLPLVPENNRVPVLLLA